MIQVIIFDLDGTLVDSAADIGRAVNRMLAGRGRPPLPLAAILPMIGEGAGRLVERALAAVGDPAGAAGAASDPAAGTDRQAALAAFLAAYAAGLTDETAPYPGAADALATFRQRGYRLALCTNKPEAPSRTILERLGLVGFFQAIVGGDSVAGCRKPDPRVLAPLLTGLAVAADRCVVVGDSATDVALARAAGMPVIVVAGGYTPVPADRLGADHVVPSLAALPAVIAGLA